MHPAVGFDDSLPHDLLHFVAEAEWGLDGAVFGQLAAGGDAGTFWPVDQQLVGKWMRRRKRLRKRPSTGRRGRRSELLAGILKRAWKARRRRTPLPRDWDERLAAARVNPEKVQAVVASLDELAERWHGLRVGDSISLEWPRVERRAHRHRLRDRRAHRRRKG